MGLCECYVKSLALAVSVSRAVATMTSLCRGNVVHVISVPELTPTFLSLGPAYVVVPRYSEGTNTQPLSPFQTFSQTIHSQYPTRTLQGINQYQSTTIHKPILHQYNGDHQVSFSLCWISPGNTNQCIGKPPTTVGHDLCSLLIHIH